MCLWLHKTEVYDNNHGVDKRFGTVKMAPGTVSLKHLQQGEVAR